ncbi:hypothetical protein VTN02DRAFT_3518 [Thermoascus thermophilus]
MSDKKRKRSHRPSEDTVEPDGKKQKREDKYKREKSKREQKRTEREALEALKYENPRMQGLDVEALKNEEQKRKAQQEKEKLETREQRVGEKKEEKAKRAQMKKERREQSLAERAAARDKASRKTDGEVDLADKEDVEAGKRDEKATDCSGLDDSKSEGDEKYKSEKHEDIKKKNRDVVNHGEEKATPYEGTHTAAEGAGQRKSTRFIVFIGNLPYSATVESVMKHFEKNPPSSVRLATEKGSSAKCRGFAFLEFDHYDRMKTCLKLYHHSSFDDGKSPARRINVELTAGGGGKSERRKAKLEAKNKRLETQRQRAAKELQKQKEQKNRESDRTAEVRKPETSHRGDGDFSGVHPSRRSRVPGA